MFWIHRLMSLNQEGWKDHKAFCRSFKTLRVESAKSITAMPQPTKGEDLDLIHHGNRSIWMLEDSLLETSLGREPTILESKFLYRENRCAHCWRRQVDLEQGGKGFKICGKCQIFATCSEDHFEETVAIHSVEVDINGRTQVSSSILNLERN